MQGKGWLETRRASSNGNMLVTSILDSISLDKVCTKQVILQISSDNACLLFGKRKWE